MLVIVEKRDQYLTSSRTPAVQYFAAWQMQYHIRRNPAEYCTKVARFGGLDTMKRVCDDQSTDRRVRELVKQVLRACACQGMAKM